jgi:hypothetical protein
VGEDLERDDKLLFTHLKTLPVARSSVESENGLGQDKFQSTGRSCNLPFVLPELLLPSRIVGRRHRARLNALHNCGSKAPGCRETAPAFGVHEGDPARPTALSFPGRWRPALLAAVRLYDTALLT